MTMETWAKWFDSYLQFNGRPVLTGKGKASAERAKTHAETEFEKYRINQDRQFESDFDRLAKQVAATKPSLAPEKPKGRKK